MQNKPSPSETPPRTMTPADRRRIFREIDENYDDANGRYLGDASDAEIANKLSVPRKWVEDIRSENFGPSGQNEEMGKLAIAIERMRVDYSALVADAMKVAEAAEAKGKELDALKSRLQAVERAVDAA